ncbi:MAG: vanadium-dependent haloperoxidase [bacterium]
MPSVISRAALLALSVSACASDTSVVPLHDTCTPIVSQSTSVGSATASGRWNALAGAIVARREFGPLGIARTFALASVAQYNAIVAAGAATSGGSPQSEAGAAAGAAATVLAGIYPGEQGAIDAQLAADAITVGSVGSECPAQFVAGVAAGKIIGAAVLARGATDRSTAPWTGTVPTGAGIWTSAPAPAAPLAPQWGQVKPWLMTSADQFRPSAPPTFNSAAYLAELTEVRRVSDARTPEQLRIAQYWGAVDHTSGPAGLWSVTGLTLALQGGSSEQTTARMLAMMHVAGMDASIACWDAKYAYWYLRPFQADPAITTPVGRPNFPSYPSAHSCLSAAYETVLASMFPSAATTLNAQLDEAGVSRIYAGLHYRFDITAGQAIGRGTAGLALSRVKDGVAIPLN